MNFREVLEKRRSVRRYKNDPVPDAVIREMIHLTRKAPSAGGIRGYEVFATDKPIVSIDAPVYLVVCARPEMYAERYGRRGRKLYSLQDATIIGSYLQLIAVDFGLATCWVGAFREGSVRKTFQLPDDWRPVTVLALGYEAE